MKELTRGEKLLAEVKALVLENNQRLASCSLPHDFSIPIDRITKEELPARRLFCKWKCTKCSAIQDFEHKHWYELGLKHASK